MSNHTETSGKYSATILDGYDHADIDIRPPFVPGQELLDLCGESTNVTLGHFATTQTVTRLTAVPRFEGMEAEEMALAFRNAAGLVIEVLQNIDEGRDVFDDRQ